MRGSNLHLLFAAYLCNAASTMDKLLHPKLPSLLSVTTVSTPSHSSRFRSLLGCVLTKASGQPYSCGIGCFRRQLSTRPAPFGAGRFFCFPLCSRSATSFAWGLMVPLPSAVNSACPFWRRPFFLLSAGSSLPPFLVLLSALLIHSDSCVEGDSLRITSCFSFTSF